MSIPISNLVRLLIALKHRSNWDAYTNVRNYIISKGLLTENTLNMEENINLFNPKYDYSDEELSQKYEDFRRMIEPFGSTSIPKKIGRYTIVRPCQN
jgi:hypothetical protein